MSYGSYRLMITTHMPSSKASAEMKIHIENLNLTLKNYIFDGPDSIYVFDFLVRFVNIYRLAKIPKIPGRTCRNAIAHEFNDASPQGSITCLPEAITCQLRTYATASAIIEVFGDLRNIR